MALVSDKYARFVHLTPCPTGGARPIKNEWGRRHPVGVAPLRLDTAGCAAAIPERTAAFCRAVARASAFIMAHPDEMPGVLARNTRLAPEVPWPPR